MTNDIISVEEYLAKGGVLTAPGNVPPRYRGELLRLMGSFVDSELAASAGFAAAINSAPGIKERIAACRITLEKADHAERVLAVMADFGTATARYQSQHDWAARVSRVDDLGQARQSGDMRLSVFHYPITDWTDAVVMNVLQGLATTVQMTELSQISYAPLAETFRQIAPREARHAELGLEGLARLVESDPGGVRDSISYWMPRVAAGFGMAHSPRFDVQARFGLRRRPNEALRDEWQSLASTRLAACGL